MASDSLSILENQGLFADQAEKDLRDEFLPWLYDETCQSLQTDIKIRTSLGGLLDQAEVSVKKAHREVTQTEEQRAQTVQKEKEQKAFEKAERKKERLEWKMRRRENRRLFALEQQFNDLYAASADIDRDIINISDIDGSDGGQMKTVGLRGGLFGELFYLLKKIKNVTGFQEVSSTWPQFNDFISSFWKATIGEGWTVYVGLDPAFEKNSLNFSEGLGFDELSSEGLAGHPAEEEESLLEYLLAHYASSFMDQTLPDLFAIRQKELAKLKYEEPEEEQEAQEEAKEEHNGEEEQEENENQEKEQEPTSGKKSEPEKDEEEEQIEVSPEIKEYKEYLLSLFKMMISSESPLKNVKFSPSIGQPPENPQELKEEKSNLDQEEVEEEQEEEQTGPVPKVLAVYIPQTPLEEDEEPPTHPPDLKPLIPTELLPPPPPSIPRGSEDEEEEEKEEEEQEVRDPFEHLRKPEAIEIYPHRPFQADFEQEDFDSMVSNLDLTKPDLNVAMVHLPLLHQLTTKFVETLFAQMQREDPDQEEELIRSLFAQTVEEVRALGSVLHRDTLYINSY